MFSQTNWIHSTSAFLTVAALLMMGAPASAWAQGAAKRTPAQASAQTSSQPPQSGASDDKLDVSEMEKKYWAAKDSDFSVVQNRLFSKAGRFTLSGSYGNMLNDPWTTGSTYSANLGYYFTERWGVELVYSNTDSQDNQAVERLKNQAGYPDHNQLKGFYGLQVMFVPFYAKMSVLSSAIIYFDMSVALGAGMQTYTQMQEEGNASVSTPAVTLDVTQNFFLHRNFALRLDLKNRWYQEETMKYRSVYANNPGRGNGSSVSNSSFLLIGVSLFY